MIIGDTERSYSMQQTFQGQVNVTSVMCFFLSYCFP